VPTLSNEEIERLDPAMFTRGPGWNREGAARNDISALFRKLYIPARDSGVHDLISTALRQEYST